MLRGKIVLYDFLNDDADFRDSDKDFANAAAGSKSATGSKMGGFMGASRVTQMQQSTHPQAIRDDEIGLKEWTYDSKVARVPTNQLDPDVQYHMRTQLF